MTAALTNADALIAYDAIVPLSRSSQHIPDLKVTISFGVSVVTAHESTFLNIVLSRTLDIRRVRHTKSTSVFASWHPEPYAAEYCLSATKATKAPTGVTRTEPAPANFTECNMLPPIRALITDEN